MKVFPQEHVDAEDISAFLFSFVFCLLLLFSSCDSLLTSTISLSYLDLDGTALALNESKFVLIPDAPVLLRSALESLSW